MSFEGSIQGQHLLHGISLRRVGGRERLDEIVQRWLRMGIYRLNEPMGYAPKEKLYATTLNTHAELILITVLLMILVLETTGEYEQARRLGAVQSATAGTYDKYSRFFYDSPNPLSPKEVCQPMGKPPSDLSGRFTELRRWASSIRLRYL